MDIGFDPRKVGGLTKDLAASLSRTYQTAATDLSIRSQDHQRIANALHFFAEYGACQTNSDGDSVCGGVCDTCRPEITKTYDTIKGATDGTPR